MSDITIRAVALTKEADDAVVWVEINGRWIETIREPWAKLYKHFTLGDFIEDLSNRPGPAPLP